MKSGEPKTHLQVSVALNVTGARTKGRSHLPDFIMPDGLSLASILDVTSGRSYVGKGPGIKNAF